MTKFSFKMRKKLEAKLEALTSNMTAAEKNAKQDKLVMLAEGLSTANSLSQVRAAAKEVLESNNDVE